MFDKETVKLGAILGSIALVLALLLSVVNSATKDVIAARQLQDTKDALTRVMPGADDYVKLENESTEKTEIYKAVKSGKSAGYCVKISPYGYGGEIVMIVGIDAEKKVCGVSIVDNSSETPGLGSHVADAEFLSQYNGKNGEMKVNKDGGEISAVSGATISSRAVTNGVNDALKAVEALEVEK